MGRKIKGKKHHGVKDPAVQKARRDNLIKGKINGKPSDIDSQEIPYKLRLIMEAKSKGKSAFLQEEKDRKSKQRELKSNGEKGLIDSSRFMGVESHLKGMTVPLKPIPLFKQRSGESDKRFINRVENETRLVLKRKEYEEKYDVDLISNPLTGETKVVNRVKDPLEKEMEEKKLKAKSKKLGIEYKSKEEKKKLKRQKEKLKKLKKKGKLSGLDLDEDNKPVKEFKDYQDSVEFNEIVHAPPELKIFKKSNETRKPGTNKDLLLNKKLKKKPTESMAKRKMLDDERQRVIDEYRSIKAQKMKNRE